MGRPDPDSCASRSDRLNRPFEFAKHNSRLDAKVWGQFAKYLASAVEIYVERCYQSSCGLFYDLVTKSSRVTEVFMVSLLELWCD